MLLFATIGSFVFIVCCWLVDMPAWYLMTLDHISERSVATSFDGVGETANDHIHTAPTFLFPRILSRNFKSYTHFLVQSIVLASWPVHVLHGLRNLFGCTQASSLARQIAFVARDLRIFYVLWSTKTCFLVKASNSNLAPDGMPSFSRLGGPACACSCMRAASLLFWPNMSFSSNSGFVIFPSLEDRCSVKQGLEHQGSSQIYSVACPARLRKQSCS